MILPKSTGIPPALVAFQKSHHHHIHCPSPTPSPSRAWPSGKCTSPALKATSLSSLVVFASQTSHILDSNIPALWIIWSTVLHNKHKLWSYTDFLSAFPIYFLRLQHSCKVIWSQLTTLFLVPTLKTLTITSCIWFLPSHSNSNLESLCLINKFICKHKKHLSQMEHSTERVYFPLVSTLPLAQNRLVKEETIRTTSSS